MWGQFDYIRDRFSAVFNRNIDHSLALKADGSIIGWGWDGRGQASPPAGNDFVAIAAGWEFSLALEQTTH